MSGSIDLYGLALAVAVLALFGWFFWHTVRSFIGAGRQVSDYLDGASRRRRASLEREAKFGPLPWWYRAGQVLSLGTLIVGLLALLWFRIMAP